jgi:uncharacterized protein YdeI (YjbR/CyaY-like superfamily)
MPQPIFFETGQAFARWLRQHASIERELLVGYHKVGSGRPSMSWPESVDEALCVGWIDGVRKRIDDAAYQIRFTPRKPGSIWSAVNIAKVEALTAQGRMQPAGLAAFEARTAHKSRVYAYEQADDAALTPAELKRFKAEAAAWSFFMNGTPPSYRKRLLHWVAAARQAATRERRLAQLVEAYARGERFR